MAEDSREGIRWTIVIAVAAWAAVVVAVWAAWEQRQDAKELLSAQISVALDTEFDSIEMRRARRRLASELIQKREVSETRVLDFFEKVAMYRHRGNIDEEMVYSAFSYWVERYWFASQDFVIAFRGQEHDSGYYGDFEKLASEMLAADAKDAHKTVLQVTPSREQVDRFLRDEAGLAL